MKLVLALLLKENRWLQLTKKLWQSTTRYWTLFWKCCKNRNLMKMQPPGLWITNCWRNSKLHTRSLLLTLVSLLEKIIHLPPGLNHWRREVNKIDRLYFSLVFEDVAAKKLDLEKIYQCNKGRWEQMYFLPGGLKLLNREMRDKRKDKVLKMM